jgi:amino acid adenylation domain-containing protein
VLSDFARSLSNAARVELPPISRAERDEGLPLSFAQQRLWFLDRINGGSAQYNLATALYIKGKLNYSALQRAFNTIVDRHEILRTTYSEKDGSPIQIIHDATTVNIASVIDLSMLQPPEQENQVLRLAKHDLHKPFNLNTDLMLRVAVGLLSVEAHVVLFTQHHIASDEWSQGILMREVIALYTAYAMGLENPLVPLPFQYADYTSWQRKRLDGEIVERQLTYWRAQLTGAPAAHSLPLKCGYPAERNIAGAIYWHKLDNDLTQRLKTLCQHEGVTLFMMLETVFALLVSRYSHEPDVIIGTPSHGRFDKEAEPLIGCFVNNLALRSRFDRNEPFRTVLMRQRQMILDAITNQDIPFEMLVEELNPERSLRRDPIFQLVFRLSNYGAVIPPLRELQITTINHDAALARVDLEVLVQQEGEQLSVGWIYRQDLFLSHTITSLAQCYVTLLREIVMRPEQNIFTYPLLDKERERVLLSQGCGMIENDKTARYVHEIFEEQVNKTPEALALTCGEEGLSYQELNAKADRLAGHLRETGVGGESRVGIFLGRSPEMLIAILGILKAGAAYVPLDLGQPRERLKHMVKDSQIDCVLLNSASLNNFPLHGLDIVIMDGAGDDPHWLRDISQSSSPEIKRKPASQHVAYVMYTSGSTGQPKGVMVTHQGLSNYLAHAKTAYLGEEIVGSVVSSPLCFDATVTTLLSPLLAGLIVELLPEGEGTLSRLANRLFDGKTGWLFKITPAHLKALEYIGVEKANQAPHRIVIGGDQLGTESLRRWKSELLPNASFVNEYGPTETVVGCSTWTLSTRSGVGHLSDLMTAPIGHAIRNTKLFVLGEGLQLQPINTIGELYIGGDGVSLGYLHQEELTGERFIENPFGEVPEGRLYKTGDLVRWLPDGELLFIGRQDNQVKINGYRIELGDVEHQLMGLPQVSSAIVVAQQESAGSNRLVAYVVLDRTVQIQDRHRENGLIAKLRRGLQEKLPAYMVPSTFVVLDQLPLTPNGKVDRKVLPKPEDCAHAGASIEPHSSMEKVICEVWQTVLRRDCVSIHDNFFSIGGDSIVSLRVLAQLKRRGITLGTKDIFECQTVEALAKRASVDGTMNEGFISIAQIAQVMDKESEKHNDSIETLI